MPYWPHKREASRPQPKPKSSKSTQEVNFGVPAPGISSYKTTIVNEKQAILEDRRKSWPHKREASRPQPKSKSVQEVNFGVPAPGISSYKTTIINAQQANLEDRRKSWPH